MTNRAEKWPVIGNDEIIRGGLGLVTDKTKKTRRLKNVKTALF